jgi:hypothetical protein
MRRLLTPGPIIGVIVVAIFALVVTIVFATPAAHPIHTPGAIALDAQLVVSGPPVYSYRVIQASQSLDNVRCEMWHAHDSRDACPNSAMLASMYFPSLEQSPMTLYVPLTPCTSTGGGSDGFNVEYLPGPRSLVMHCYAAHPMISTGPRFMGVEAVPSTALLVVPTQSISAGTVDIIEDVRIEHLLGDESSEYQLGTATVS